MVIKMALGFSLLIIIYLRCGLEELLRFVSVEWFSCGEETRLCGLALLF
jgi:hypothetical protein